MPYPLPCGPGEDAIPAHSGNRDLFGLIPFEAMTRTSLFPLCLALSLLAGCRDEDTAQVPAPPAAKPATLAAPKATEPPPFTAADSSPQAAVEEGTASAPKFTPPAAEPAKPAEKPKAATAAKPEKKPAAKAAPEAPASTPSTSTVQLTPQGEWVLQVGIHRTEDGARAMASKLKAKGFPAYVLNVATGATGLSGSYYRVRIGAFATREDALRYGENVLKPAGLKDFWADKKSNEAKAREAQLPTP